MTEGIAPDARRHNLLVAEGWRWLCGFVKHEVIEALNLTVTEAATVPGVTRPALSAVLNERARLSPEIALRVEKAFGVSMDTLMRMQNSYDIAKTRMRAGEIKVSSFESAGGFSAG